MLFGMENAESGAGRHRKRPGSLLAGRRAPWWRRLARLHRDQRGSLLDYGMVLAAICMVLIGLFGPLFYVLSEYFSMIAFYVTWPFL
jgi:hypothetical protein